MAALVRTRTRSGWGQASDGRRQGLFQGDEGEREGMMKAFEHLLVFVRQDEIRLRRSQE